QARAGRRLAVRGQPARKGLSSEKLRRNAPVNGAVQDRASLERDLAWIGAGGFLEAHILGDEFHPRFLDRSERRVSVMIDGGIHDRAAELLAIGRQVGATARKAEAQRCPRAYQHRDPTLFELGRSSELKRP